MCQIGNRNTYSLSHNRFFLMFFTVLLCHNRTQYQILARRSDSKHSLVNNRDYKLQLTIHLLLSYAKPLPLSEEDSESSASIQERISSFAFWLMEVLLRAQAILNSVRSSSVKNTTSFTVFSSDSLRLDTFHPLLYLPQLCH
jgi:hypothetical protein